MPRFMKIARAVDSDPGHGFGEERQIVQKIPNEFWFRLTEMKVWIYIR